MRKLSTIVGLVAFASLRAAVPPGTVIDLWPEGVPDRNPAGGEERYVEGRYYNVQNPTLVFFPSEKPSGTAVILAPGGGYERLAIGTDGGDLTKWFNRLGVSVFVLKYRLKEYRPPAALRDGLRAVRMVRSRAEEFGVKADRIGFFGGSAGGHVAAITGTMFDSAEGKTGAALDKVSARPDFLMMLFPVITMRAPFAHGGSRDNLIGKSASPEQTDQMSAELHVTKDTPPTFLVASQADTTVRMENSILFYRALHDAGVPVEMHLYEKGPHGFTFAKNLGTTSLWPERAEEWLRAHGWVEKAK